MPYNLFMASNAGIVGRLDIRLSKEAKRQVEEAAVIQGMTVTAFVLSTALEAARKVKREHQVTVLNDEERDAFIEMMTSPPEPSEALIRLMGTEVVL